MALLALPLAQSSSAEVTVLEQRLGQILGELKDIQDTDDERRLLDGLMELSARAEAIRARSAFRFGATRAYYAIARERVERLSGEPVGELPNLFAFIDRRLIPAMRTCDSVQQRQDQVAARITRAADLLDTRVNLGLEEQNRNLLSSMEQRARAQLRLQQTVEGLSVAAISYYLVGLVAYLSKGLQAWGMPVSTPVVVGLSVPVVVIAVWSGLRRVHRRVAH